MRRCSLHRSRGASHTSCFPGRDASLAYADQLTPHLSHDEGRKLDLALYDQDAKGNFRNGETRSLIGYFAFQEPGVDAPQPCADRARWLTLRWHVDWLQGAFPDRRIEPQRMREALRWLSNEVIRFQGCRAARHDDHIHIQLH